jgi:ferredoxin
VNLQTPYWHSIAVLTHELGACGGSCACSTCHVIVTDESFYDKMTEPDDDENDMLDLAFGLTETSRLGCQVKMTKELDGVTVKLPSMTRNMQASDFAEKK